MDLVRLAAFSMADTGGNPAGVAFVDAMPADTIMLSVAAEVGYSETAFLQPIDQGWRVRYFAPRTEVPFCGHATIASAAALGARHGEGRFRFVLNDSTIAVDAIRGADDSWGAALQSPPTWSRAVPDVLSNAFLLAFRIADRDLDMKLPVRLAHAGANHLVVPLATRQRLATMTYPFDAVKTLMNEHDITTVSLVHAESPTRYHARNAFAVGGVYEDPATGAAAAAFAGYLRDVGFLDSGEIAIRQGDDMGQPSLLNVQFGPARGTSVRVSGRVRSLD